MTRRGIIRAYLIIPLTTYQRNCGLSPLLLITRDTWALERGILIGNIGTGIAIIANERLSVFDPDC